MLEAQMPVYHLVVPNEKPRESPGVGGPIPNYALPPPSPGEAEGYKVWDFKYHEGHSILLGGGKGKLPSVHCHPHFEIFWIRAGAGVLNGDADEVAIGPRTLVIVGPGALHSWKETHNMEGTVLSFTEAFTSTFNFSIPFSELASFLRPHGTVALQLGPRDEDLVAGMLNLIRAPGGASNFEARDVVKAFLLVVFGGLGDLPDDGAAPEARPSLLTRRFNQALASEFPRLATVKEFAQFLRVSRSYLHRTVLRDTGRSPSHLIRDRIVFEGKRLLLHTAQSPADIAHHLGFRSASYFSSFFRKHTELTPRAFRSGGGG
jgi:AraC-like DNA-binding protein/mannose-6-phosphate isomerase-like protein (cupin superfamily)